MGTSAFAVPALLLLSKHHAIQAVFTQAPKPHGRGLQPKLSPVHEAANTLKIPVYTPQTLRSIESFELVNNIEAEVIVVCSYGLLVPKNILDAKKYGCLNIHPSLLPKYRGAAPLQRAIINGDEKTAVCIMQMDEGLDTGPVILQEDLPIEDMDYIQLHNKCANIGANLLLEAIANINTLPRIKQSDEGVSYAHKLSKEEAKIDWHESAKQINCQIRGMNPWPGTFFSYNDLEIKVLKAKVIEIEHNFLPGAVINDELHVACGRGILALEIIQKPGSKALQTTDLLRGYPIKINTLLK
jgi:methionyl-tRNA formyltransferase